MPVTTLNKIVAQLLTGAVTLTFIFALHRHQIEPLLQNANVLVNGFLVVSLTALLGAIVDGVSEVTVHLFIRKTAQSRVLARFLFRSKERQDFAFWLKCFKSLAKGGPHYEWQVISEDNRKEPDESAVLAIIAGSFLRDAKSEEFQWLVQHYSGFTLLSSFAAVIGAVVIYVTLYCTFAWTEWWWPLQLPSQCGQTIFILLAGIATLWVLLSYAASKWLYSYELSARHACLMLAERKTLPSSQRHPRP